MQPNFRVAGLTDMLPNNSLFWDTPLYQNFWAGIASGFIVFVIGIPVGLAINRLVLGAGAKEKKYQLLESLNLALQSNKERIIALRDDTESFITDHVDLVIFDSTAALKYELLGIPLARKIDAIRLQLVDVGRGLDAYHAMLVGLVAGTKTGNESEVAVFNLMNEYVAGFRQRIMTENCPFIIDAIEACQEEIHHQMTNLYPKLSVRGR